MPFLLELVYLAHENIDSEQLKVHRDAFRLQVKTRNKIFNQKQVFILEMFVLKKEE